MSDLTGWCEVGEGRYEGGEGRYEGGEGRYEGGEGRYEGGEGRYEVGEGTYAVARRSYEVEGGVRRSKMPTGATQGHTSSRHHEFGTMKYRIEKRKNRFDIKTPFRNTCSLNLPRAASSISIPTSCLLAKTSLFQLLPVSV